MDEGESVPGSAVAAEVDLAMGRAARDSEAGAADLAAEGETVVVDPGIPVGAVDSGWAEDVRPGR